MTDRKKTQRIRIVLTVDVDVDGWGLEYGVTGRRELAEDVKNYAREAILFGTAGGELMEEVR